MAQAGASCQTFSDSKTAIGFEQKFKCKYSLVPFSQTYVYEADAEQTGVYVKYVKGQKALLDLPTVMVDFTTDGNGEYQTLTEFTCKEKLGVVVATELRISSRDKQLDDATLEDLKQRALDLGIPPQELSKITIVDHSRCKDMDDEVEFLQ